jgi:hypothetical protein
MFKRVLCAMAMATGVSLKRMICVVMIAAGAWLIPTPASAQMT